MKPNSELLKDLSILLARYPPDDWKQVSLILEDRESREQIVSVLKALEDLSRASKSAARSVEGGRPEAEAKVFGREESAEYRKLTTKLNQMPTAQLKAFAAQSGIKVAAKDSRERVLRRLLAAVSPRGAGSSVRGTAPQQKKARDGEYGKWVKIIMGRQ